MLVIAVGLLLVGPAIYKLHHTLSVRRDARDARRFVTQHKYEEAREPLGRWLVATPGSAEAHFLAARVRFAGGQAEQAIRELGLARAAGYSPRELERQEAIIRAHLGRHDEAMSVLRRVLLSSSSPDPEADEALARCYLETFQLGQAEGVINRWIEDAPGDVKPHQWKLDLARRVNADATTMIEILGRILELDPNSEQARLSLAETYLQAHRLDEADREYAACRAARPDSSAVERGLGLIAMERGDEAVAQRHLDRSVELDPRDFRPLLERANLQVGRGQFEAALADIDRAMTIDDGEPEVHYRRSLVLARMGRNVEAQAERDRSSQLREERIRIQKLLKDMLAAPGDLGRQYDAARWLFAHGHPEEGLRWAQKIVREQPRHAGACGLLADYHEKRGDHGLANYYRMQAGSEP